MRFLTATQLRSQSCILLAFVLLVGCHRNPVRRASAPSLMLLKMAAHSVKPSYPDSLRAAGVGGQVVVEIVVSPSGSILESRIVESPNDELGAATLSAVRQWNFMSNSGGKGPAEFIGTLAFSFDPKSGFVGIVGTRPPDTETPAKPSAASVEKRGSLSDPVVKSLLAAEGTMLLDIRDRAAFRRSHSTGALNIPFEEIPARKGEFSGLKVVVVDCVQEAAANCTPVASFLTRIDVPRVIIAGSTITPDPQETIDGLVARGIELLERGDNLAFMAELGDPTVLRRLQQNSGKSLDRYVDALPKGTFPKYLAILKACQRLTPQASQEFAVFILTQPIEGTSRFGLTRIGGRWFLLL